MFSCSSASRLLIYSKKMGKASKKADVAFPILEIKRRETTNLTLTVISNVKDITHPSTGYHFSVLRVNLKQLISGKCSIRKTII